MKKLFGGTLLGLVAIAVSVPAMAAVDISVGISLPPAIEFAAPPQVIVIPGTYVYVVPELDVDLFFYNGWWWRPWEGHWYRSRQYNSGWAYYRGIPSFYARIPTDWRNYYADRRWEGLQWNYQPIPERQLRHNWHIWQVRGHWERQQNWGVQGWQPRMHSRRSYGAREPQFHGRSNRGR